VSARRRRRLTVAQGGRLSQLASLLTRLRLASLFRLAAGGKLHPWAAGLRFAPGAAPQHLQTSGLGTQYRHTSRKSSWHPGKAVAAAEAHFCCQLPMPSRLVTAALSKLYDSGHSSGDSGAQQRWNSSHLSRLTSCWSAAARTSRSSPCRRSCPRGGRRRGGVPAPLHRRWGTSAKQHPAGSQSADS
jgi:hypothetical protein